MARELKPIIRPEDLEATVRRIADGMAETGREAASEMRVVELARGRSFETAPIETDLDALVVRAIAALSDEVAIAEEANVVAKPGTDFIQQRERDLEISKKALIRLNLPQLRHLADNVGLDSRGTLEEVVNRIAGEYQGDPAEIARLVLRYEEARPERGLVDRVYAVQQAMDDSAHSAELLNAVRGRYIRVGIARWFVFQNARADKNGLWLEGLYRSYSADAKREGEDFELVALPTDATVTARVRPEQRFIEIRSRGDAESRGILRALEWGTKLHHTEPFPLDVGVAEGPMMKWDPRSVWMLHFLDRRLPDSGIRIINLTSARFETAVAERGFSRRPAVQSVALHGQHLLSSKAACELLADGRALVELSLDVLFKPQQGTELLFPIRVSLARDQVTVLTGFGAHSPELAAQLHREILRRVRMELTHRVESDDRLESLSRRIIDRAKSNTPVSRADIFAPPEDWSPDIESDDDSGAI